MSDGVRLTRGGRSVVLLVDGGGEIDNASITVDGETLTMDGAEPVTMHDGEACTADVVGMLTEHARLCRTQPDGCAPRIAALHIALAGHDLVAIEAMLSEGTYDAVQMIVERRAS